MSVVRARNETFLVLWVRVNESQPSTPTTQTQETHTQKDVGLPIYLLQYTASFITITMSRSALWRQEGAKKAREEQAEELFCIAVEEGRNNRAKGLLPLWGPDDSFHLNPMLLQNIIKSNYFQKYCRDITDWSALVDEIYYQVKHLEPWAIGTF